jgi:hypothetical protein
MPEITALPSETALEAGDLLVVVDNPGGTPVTKKITFSNLVAQVIDNITSGGTGKTITVSAVDPTTGNPVTLEFEGGVLKV